MAISTRIKEAINSGLSGLNLELETLTSKKNELERINRLEKKGQFKDAIYEPCQNMVNFDASKIIDAYSKNIAEIANLNDPIGNKVGYDPTNTFFNAPDAEILYLMVRAHQPKRIIEIGCGSSTRISRRAISDGGFACQLVAIDPQPRNEISDLVDVVIRKRLEEVDDLSIFQTLTAGDILFIDSSHECRIGNDVAQIFCRIIPALAPGVIVHVHDIFLPYEYPVDWALSEWYWGEQYLLQMLLASNAYEVLWPGHYVQKTRPELSKDLPFMSNGRAQSFWFRR